MAQVNNLSYGKDGIQLTGQFEGLRLTAYQDQVGVWRVDHRLRAHRAGRVSRPRNHPERRHFVHALLEELSFSRRTPAQQTGDELSAGVVPLGELADRVIEIAGVRQAQQCGAREGVRP